MQIHFPFARTPPLHYTDKTVTAIYENVACLSKETHKIHKCKVWRIYLDVYFQSGCYIL
jgi:hypothetical protein